jgi:hypothetical protein
VRPWTTAEEEALRHLSHLGARALSEAFERPQPSIENKARRLHVSLRRRGSSGFPESALSAAGLRRARELMAAPLCPACGKRPAGVRRTGFCWRCHLEALRAVHEEEIAHLEGQRELWAARSKLRRRRREFDRAEGATSHLRRRHATHQPPPRSEPRSVG